MLDETELRSSKLHVERAKFEVKGTFNPELKRKRKKMDKKTKQLQQDKFLNWDERPEVIRHKHERIVVLKNMFDLQQFKVSLFEESLQNLLEKRLQIKLFIYLKNIGNLLLYCINKLGCRNSINSQKENISSSFF